ncbi:MAG: hypothetical protein ACE15B_15650 [Bryobacteraceae bacterium]
MLDADAANEMDDQFALSLALGFPERIRLEGLVGAHFVPAGGAAGIQKSYGGQGAGGLAAYAPAAARVESRSAS